LKIEDSQETITIDSIALDGKTYREIFENGSVLDIEPGFADGTWGTLEPYSESTTPTLVAKTNVIGAIGNYVLESTGTPSKQLKSRALGSTEVPMFLGSRVKCTSYTVGGLGQMIDNASASSGVQHVTESTDDDWVVAANIVTKTLSATSRVYVGSYSSANLDGYTDMPVAVPMSIFTNTPTAGEMSKAYKVYLEIYRNNGSIDVTTYATLVHDAMTTIDSENCHVLINETSEKPMTFSATPYIACTDDEARQSFYDEMNDFALQLGMTNTHFDSAAGYIGGEFGTNIITTNDMARLGMKGLDYREACTVWNCPSKTIKSTGVERTINLQSTVVDHGGFADVMKVDYVLLGGKTGSYNQRSNYCINMQAKSTNDVFTVCCTASGYTETSSRNRHINAKKLADIGKLLRAAGEYAITDSDNIQNAECKAAVKAIEQSLFDSGDCECATVLLTPAHPGSYDGVDIYDSTNPCHIFLYSHNGNTTFAAASTTKMMTMLLVLDWVTDLHDTFKLLPEDVTPGSGPVFSGGEIFTYMDLLYALMLPSSNTSAQAFARVIGQKIYSNKHRDYKQILHLQNKMSAISQAYLGTLENNRTGRLSSGDSNIARGILIKNGETITLTGLAPAGKTALRVDYVYATESGPQPVLVSGSGTNWDKAVGTASNFVTANFFPLNTEGNNTLSITNTYGVDYYYFFNFAGPNKTETLNPLDYAISYEIQ